MTARITLQQQIDVLKNLNIQDPIQEVADRYGLKYYQVWLQRDKLDKWLIQWMNDGSPDLEEYEQNPPPWVLAERKLQAQQNRIDRPVVKRPAKVKVTTDSDWYQPSPTTLFELGFRPGSVLQATHKPELLCEVVAPNRLRWQGVLYSKSLLVKVWNKLHGRSVWTGNWRNYLKEPGCPETLLQRAVRMGY